MSQPDTEAHVADILDLKEQFNTFIFCARFEKKNFYDSNFRFTLSMKLHICELYVTVLRDSNYFLNWLPLKGNAFFPIKIERNKEYNISTFFLFFVSNKFFLNSNKNKNTCWLIFYKKILFKDGPISIYITFYIQSSSFTCIMMI